MKDEIKRGTVTNNTDNRIFYRVYQDIYISGLIKKFAPQEWTLLGAIASYMNESGTCFPTQEQLADRLGWSRKSVNKWVQSLAKITWNGQPVIECNYHGKFNKNMVYRVLPQSQIAIFGGEVTPITAEVESHDVTDVLQHSEEEASRSNRTVTTEKSSHVTDVLLRSNRTVTPEVTDVLHPKTPNGYTNNNHINNNQLNNNHLNNINNKDSNILLDKDKKEINSNSNITDNITVRETKDIREESPKDTPITVKELPPSPVVNKTKNTVARDLVNYFSVCYSEKFVGEAFRINWKRDIPLVENLLQIYTEEQLQRLIEVAITQYRFRWASEKYPRPTVWCGQPFNLAG